MPGLAYFVIKTAHN